jgi:pimeloyl-ACP methyl ester carboxylesterase
MSTPIDHAGAILARAPTSVVSVSPVVLPAPGRAVDLEMRVSAPVTGRDLPVILLSHGHGSSNHLSSLNGYGPLANFYAAHGFVVIQPTHLSSKTLSSDPRVDANGPEGPLHWRSRAQDMRRILDGLDVVEAAMSGLGGRMDRGRVAVVGHSLGGHTAALLLGMRITGPEDVAGEDLADQRIRAGVLLGAPGGSVGANGTLADRFPVLRNGDFSTMTTPALVVTGDRDVNPMFSDRADWRADAYFLSPGPKCLLTVFGGEHILGGISGYDAAETTDESPERVSLVQRLTLAYLRTALYPEDRAWDAAQASLAEMAEPQGRIECK